MIEILLVLVLAQETVATDVSCAKCHEPPRTQWHDSVHARHGIGCVACHGSDEVGKGDMPHAKNPMTFLAGTKKTSHQICMKCHDGVWQAFQKSSHWDDTQDEEGKVKSCLSCHAAHTTHVADRKMILDQSCSKCHKENTVQRRIMNSYIAATSELERNRDLLRAALSHKIAGVSWKTEEESLEEAERVLREARMEQHKTARGNVKGGGNFKGLEDSLPAAAKDAQAAQGSLAAKVQDTRKRPLLLLGFLGLLGLYLLLLRTKLIRWGHAA